MSIPDHSMSLVPMPADWLPPDELYHLPTEDYEAGPVALNDTSEGLSYQAWHLTYDPITEDLTVTPAVVGSPVVVLNVVGLTQCTMAFDQNGHINIAYTAGGSAFLYWYDTDISSWTTAPLEAGVTTPTICLDDKRTTQTNSSDILLLYTIERTTDVFTLYSREQRDRFLTEYPHTVGVPPYLHKLGMHNELRVQIGLSNTIL